MEDGGTVSIALVESSVLKESDQIKVGQPAPTHKDCKVLGQQKWQFSWVWQVKEDLA